MSNIDMLIILLPLIIIQLSLMITALISIFKQDTYKYGNRIMWVLIVVLINMIGPVLYFVLGRDK